jgi:hypothetical protein
MEIVKYPASITDVCNFRLAFSSFNNIVETDSSILITTVVQRHTEINWPALFDWYWAREQFDDAQTDSEPGHPQA